MTHTEPPADDVLDIAHARLMCQRGVARALRVGAGLRLSDIARAVNVSEASVSRWETKKRGPSNPEVAVALGRLYRKLAQ